MKVICKGCGKELELSVENFHRHPDNRTGFKGSCRDCVNKQRNKRDTKYTYFYEIEKNGIKKSGQIKAKDKDIAIKKMKLLNFGWTINKLCTFKYKNKEKVQPKRGNRK